MPTRPAGQAGPPAAAKNSVFLNLPYDPRFETLFLGYIAAVSAFGLVPRTSVEIPGGTRRLERILDLIARCGYSIHDLSRVQLDRKAPRTPRFNMPFELGLAVAVARQHPTHTWFVFEEEKFRLSKSLSDLDGTDPYIHGGTLKGLFAEMGNAFVGALRQPTAAQMETIYRELRLGISKVLRRTGTSTLFGARPFKELSTVASALADQVVLGRNL